MPKANLIPPYGAKLVNLVVDVKGLVEIEGFSRKTSDLVTALDKSKLFKTILDPAEQRSNAERPALGLEVHLLSVSICTPSSPAGPPGGTQSASALSSSVSIF